MVDKVLEKMSIKDLGFHIHQFLELYLAPRKSWKKAVLGRKKGFEFIIHHIIYYSILLMVFEPSWNKVITIVIIEILVSLVPFAFFICPFLFFNRRFNLHLSWQALFRFILIVKLQFLPFVLIGILFARWSNIEEILIFVHDILWFFWIAIIVVLPLILKIKLHYKVIWIFANYLFFLVGLPAVSYNLNQLSENSKLFRDSNFPFQEIFFYESNRHLANNQLKDEFLLVVLNEKEENGSYVQMLSQELYLRYLEAKMQQYEKLMTVDSLMESDVSTEEGVRFLKDKYGGPPILDKKTLDSFRIDFVEKFHSDYALIARIQDSVRFQTNKEYYRNLLEYFDEYRNLHSNVDTIQTLIETSELESYLTLDERHQLLLYNVDTEKWYPAKNNWMESKGFIDQREKRASILPTILFYPMELLITFFDVHE